MKHPYHVLQNTIKLKPVKEDLFAPLDNRTKDKLTGLHIGHKEEEILIINKADITYLIKNGFTVEFV